MCRIIARPFLRLLLALPPATAAVPAALAADAYDVSYVWSHNAAGVLAYRDKVGQVLGPAVAKDLRVVAREKLIGLIYQRRGDSDGAARVARAHTALLRSRGLEPAAPIRSRDWLLLDSAAAQTAATLSDTPPAEAAAPPGASAVPASVPKYAPEAAANEARIELASLAPVSIPQVTTLKQSAQQARNQRNLEQAVEEYIERLRREGKIAPDERTGWSVYDFTTGEKLVTINEDMQFQAASLVKPFIAAAFFYKVEQGELSYGPTSRQHLRQMIQRSNNASTNWVTRQVGGPAAVERILKRQHPGIFRNTHLVEYIPSDGRSYRNKASLHDYSRFLYALWKEEITGAREIKRLMALPGSDRIFTGAREIPRNTKVYNKTGSTARLCGDMGILSVMGPDGKRYPYTLIGVIEKAQSADNYTSWIRSRSDVIRNVSNIIYKGIAEHHNI